MSRIIYCHSVAGSYPERELAGIYSAWLYATRVYPCTLPGDCIQLPPEVELELPWARDHYFRVGLQPTSDIIWNLDLDGHRQRPGYEWSVFLYSHLHHETHGDKRWFDAAAAMNNKNHFIALCQRLGATVPPTQCYTSKAAFGMAKFKAHYPLYRKTAVSASGVGVRLCSNADELAADLETMEEGVPFQLQQAIPSPKAFINVQYGVTPEGRASRIGITDQILDGYAHAGNRYPTQFPSGVWELCDPVAHAIAEMGLKGIFAFDVGIDGNDKPVLIEANPRWNACTYYWTVAHRLGMPCWHFQNQMVDVRTLSKLDINGLEYDPVTKKGLVVVLWGTVLKGKLGVLYGGHSYEECVGLQQEFVRRNGASH